MTIHAVSPPSTLLTVGGQWRIEVCVTDLDGAAIDTAPVVTVTLPDDTTATPTVETVTLGRYRATYTPTLVGRHVARAATGDDVANLAAYATTTTTASGMPTTDDVADYLREGAASWATADLQNALDAELAAQRAACRVRAVYPDDLRQALLRRVQRNLALRQLPLAVHQGDAEAGAMLLPGRDPEVRRLEAPHRRLVMG